MQPDRTTLRSNPAVEYAQTEVTPEGQPNATETNAAPDGVDIESDFQSDEKESVDAGYNSDHPTGDGGNYSGPPIRTTAYQTGRGRTGRQESNEESINGQSNNSLNSNRSAGDYLRDWGIYRSSGIVRIGNNGTLASKDTEGRQVDDSREIPNNSAGDLRAGGSRGGGDRDFGNEVKDDGGNNSTTKRAQNSQGTNRPAGSDDCGLEDGSPRTSENDSCNYHVVAGDNDNAGRSGQRQSGGDPNKEINETTQPPQITDRQDAELGEVDDPDDGDDAVLSVGEVEDEERLSAQNTAKLSAQINTNSIVYNKSTHKRSRIKKGQLIKRLTGYSIAETEYGVSYLWVLSRKPDLTTADNSVYPLAGYFNWKSLEASGLLRKERKTNAK